LQGCFGQPPRKELHMRKAILSALFASAAGVIAAGPAAAHDYLYHPYVIQKNCDEYGHHCRVRMDYAPHEHAGLAGAGSYWYRNPGQGHYHVMEVHHKWRPRFGEDESGCKGNKTNC
jgi:hypothetical protein